MELHSVRLVIPENGNIIVGQSHFIKTVEDIYEAIVGTVPASRLMRRRARALLALTATIRNWKASPPKTHS
jgi:adenosine/AMP kinase